MKNRRTHFFINKPLQLRYMFFLIFILLTVCGIVLATSYVSIWSNILKSFSNASVRNDLLTAARIAQYEEARYQTQGEPLTALSLFKESEKLSARQREIFKDILNDTNRQLAVKLLILLFFIAWGSIFLSHKIAGPLYRLHKGFQELQNGNLKTRISLRKFDEAKSLAEDFNHAALFLDEHTQRLKTILKENRDQHEKLVSRLNDELSKIKSSGD